MLEWAACDCSPIKFFLFFSPLKIFKNFGTLKKLLDGFVRESSMPAVFSKRDTNLRVFAVLKQDLSGFLDDCAQNLASK